MVRKSISEIEENGLFSLLEPTEIVDRNGLVIGVFTPSAEYLAELFEHPIERMTEEELDRLASEPGGCSTAELLQKLNQL
jgi:hypothetical protein